MEKINFEYVRVPQYNHTNCIFSNLHGIYGGVYKVVIAIFAL